jgi:hypothetical protein
LTPLRSSVAALLIAPSGTQGLAAGRPPIIDMHVHAYPANAQGLPRLAMCTPIDPMPNRDQAGPYAQTFLSRLKNPIGDDPVWSPLTDEELMTRTVAVMKRQK